MNHSNITLIKVFIALMILIANVGFKVQVRANEASFSWPQHYQAAVSLSYDDGLMSQLNHAIPALDKHGFKASFFLTLSNPNIQVTLEQWRSIAANGHELGNHTLFHPCSKSIDGREWVESYHNMDSKTVAQMQQEVALASTFLQAIDR